MYRRTSTLLLIAAITGLALSSPALAVYPPPMKDEGKFFSKEAVDKANKKIREIYEKYKKDVLVETLASLTVDQEKQQKEEGSDRYFNKLALSRAREMGLNGVYILIVKKPRYLRIHMDPETQKNSFTAENRKEVLQKITAQFREENFDEGLLDGLNTIDKIFGSKSQALPSKK